MTTARLNRRGALAAGALALWLALGGSASATDKVGDRPIVVGNPNAPITIVEYASVTCPHCARFNTNVFPALKAKYLDTGKARFEFREFPTEPVNLAAAGFMIARCAGPERYMAVVDALFRAQAQLYASKDISAFLMAGARAGGLAEDQMRACISDATALQAFNTRYTHTSEVEKIDATPTIRINGKAVDSGDREMAIGDIDAAIRPLLGATAAKPVRKVRRRPQP